MTETAPKDAPGAGFVRSNLERGALLVEADAGGVFRLSWGEGDAQAPKQASEKAALRPLPPGGYTLVGYRVLAADGEGHPWFLSVTGSRIGEFTVKAGETVRVDVDPTVHLMHKPMLKHGDVAVSMKFLNARDAGMSLYRDGRRIGVQAVVEDGQGRKLAEGAIEYG